MRCKVTKKKIKTIMSFGRMPMANGFLLKKDFHKEFFYDLKVGFNKKNFLFQVDNHPKSTKIFNDRYPFFTHKSKFMIDHFKKFFKWIQNNYLTKNDKIIEIGSNDGTFLSYFAKKNYSVIGYEPSLNVANVARKKGLKVISKFFNYKNVSINKKNKNQINLICAANVICHIPDLKNLIKSLDYLLAKDGLFIFEEPYLGSMFKRVSYDQIYDAHVFIFSLHSVKSIFNSFGFDLINALPQKTHGGSMRYVVARKNVFEPNSRVNHLLIKEKQNKLHLIDSCFKFKKKCEESRRKFKIKIKKLKINGKKICGYAASAKSTTALNYCGIDHSYIDFIVDSTKEKIGKFTPGTHIPIKSPDYFRKNYPDVAILNSWNHKKEILKKERKFKLRGGKWISHVK
jgi:methylation protein EvaC